MKKSIKTIAQFENFLFANFKATVSSVEEINSYGQYSLVGDNEHDYSKLVKVYKVLGEYHPRNEFEEVFILIFSKNGGISDSKTLGLQTERLEKMWQIVEWEE